MGKNMISSAPTTTTEHTVPKQAATEGDSVKMRVHIEPCAMILTVWNIHKRNVVLFSFTSSVYWDDGDCILMALVKNIQGEVSFWDVGAVRATDFSLLSLVFKKH